MAAKKAKLNSRARKLILAAALVIVCAAALFVFLNRDEISARYSRDDGVSAAEPFTYEAGSMQVFASVGNGAAIASTNGLQLLSSSGTTIVRQVFSMGTPALTACADAAAAYDIGGADVYVARLTGECVKLENTETIISASMNEGGCLALCTETVGYRGRVTVYDAALRPVYEWSSGDDYLLGARVSPNGGYLAALCAGSEGASVHFFSLSSENELSCYKDSGTLVTDMDFLEDDRVLLLAQDRCIVIDRSSEVRGSYDFAGAYLADYTFDSAGCAILMLGKYRSGGEGRLVSVGPDGKLLGETAIEASLEALCASGRSVAALCSDGVYTFTATLTGSLRDDDILGVSDLLVREDGQILLMSSYSAELRSY